MNIGDRYQAVRLLNPKRFPDSTHQNEKQNLFTILAINADDTVLIQLQDGTIQTESSWFIRHYCKRV